ncbi:TetR/AcrR family transcriptional regulator [Bacteroidales bacterium OttesenSCG-928-K03]|nr:TetR/AcrR family transcriptional regulator [Odoribacter sp. OttesenSCG-928-L07]MDL2240500.1 TetR/AcrR family transcriptional regulator [Bacteroidales bacterium OttesenSCG-928-K22]MDL2242840.1 TetR/AcrR family transcriptional regulator [Bacteroidales bacterium OttesenSCG-928-K03]
MSKVDKTREEIKDAASALFQHYGYEKTSMDDIAKACHKAKGSIYYHFASKEELYSSIVDDEIEKLKNVLLPILTNKNETAPLRFANYIYAKMAFVNNSYTYRQALKMDFLSQSGITQYSKLIQESIANFEKWEREQLMTLVITGKNDGDISDNIDATAFIDIVFMILKSLEVQFYVKNKYEYYSPAFNALLVNVAQALSS